MVLRYFKGDKWNKILGSRIPLGALVEVVRFYPRRRAMVKYNGDLKLTMAWCLVKPEKWKSR